MWLGELTHFWDVAEQAGYETDIASPSGGRIPLDSESLAHDVLAELCTEKRYMDRAYMNLLENIKKVSDVKLEDCGAIYLTAGHGTMFDFRRARTWPI